MERNFHPTIIVSGYLKALQVIFPPTITSPLHYGRLCYLQLALDTCSKICRTIDVANMTEMREVVTSAIGTKFSARWGPQMVDMAISAVRKVVQRRGEYTEVDVKRYVRIEKIPGGQLSDCCVLDGVMFNKDVTHSKMRRRIENPRILLLDCPLEYKKGESQTNVEIMNEEDFNALLRQEEEYIEQICANVRPHPLLTKPPLNASSSIDCCVQAGYRDYRERGVGPGATLLLEGGHHRLPSTSQDRPEPRSSRNWSHHRQSTGRDPGVRHWSRLRPLRSAQDRR